MISAASAPRRATRPRKEQQLLVPPPPEREARSISLALGGTAELCPRCFGVISHRRRRLLCTKHGRKDVNGVVCMQMCVLCVSFSRVPPALVQPVAPSSEHLGQDQY